MSSGDKTLKRPDAAYAAPTDNAETRGRSFTVVREEETLPPALSGAVAAIGNFDGVHRGHRALIDAVRTDAAQIGRPGVALTFEPHPRAFFAPDQPMFRLTSPAAKELVFAWLGLDGLIVRRFDRVLAETSATEFVAQLLKRDLSVSQVVIGHDFHFGRGREGNPAMLKTLCEQAGLGCRIVEAVSVAQGTMPVSSSSIRAALGAGEISAANRLLGYRWFVLGKVQHGEKRGRDLGYPTANLRLGSCGLAHGIYAVRARLSGGALRDGVASYGRRPTFDDGAPLLEVNLFDFSGDLYDLPIAVEFVTYLRGEERFDSAEALIAQMHLDAAAARAVLREDETPSVLG